MLKKTKNNNWNLTFIFEYDAMTHAMEFATHGMILIEENLAKFWYES